MKRRTLDLFFAAGAAAFALMLAVFAVVQTTNARFAIHDVRRQLVSQHIVFPTRPELTAQQVSSPCLVANAGKLLTSGRQAGCYADHYVAAHAKTIAGGQTYSDLADAQVGLRTQIAALKPGDPALKSLQAQLDVINAQREALFHAETQRGLLLTSSNLSEFGRTASRSAQVAFAGAVLFALLALAGFVHALAEGRVGTAGQSTTATRRFRPLVGLHKA